jgi:hypothetical protein
MTVIEVQVLKRRRAYQSDAPGPETFCGPLPLKEDEL